VYLNNKIYRDFTHEEVSENKRQLSERKDSEKKPKDLILLLDKFNRKANVSWLSHNYKKFSNVKVVKEDLIQKLK